MADGVDLAAKNRDACWPALSAAVAAGLKKRPAPDLDKLFPIIQVSSDPKSHVRLHWEGAKERESLTVRKLGVEVRNLYEVRAIMPIAADQMDPELNPYILPVVTAWSSTSQQHILDWIVEQMVQAAHDGGVLDPVALNSHLPWGKLPMRVIVFTADENAVKAVKLLARISAQGVGAIPVSAVTPLICGDDAGGFGGRVGVLWRMVGETRFRSSFAVREPARPNGVDGP